MSCALRKGEIVGLVGPNGAGKTTLLLTLMGFLRADEGEVHFGERRIHCGASPEGAFFISDHPPFFGFLTVSEHLEAVASLAAAGINRERIRIALSQSGLSAYAEHRVAELSRGLAQRLAWAQAIVVRPRILFLDEPTTALDPSGVIALREFVQGESQRGCAVLFSSHSLAEVSRLSHRVLLLQAGKLSELHPSGDRRRARYEVRASCVTRDGIRRIEGFAEEVVQEGRIIRFSVPGTPSITEIVGKLEGCGIEIVEIANVSRSLEHAWIERTAG